MNFLPCFISMPLETASINILLKSVILCLLLENRLVFYGGHMWNKLPVAYTMSIFVSQYQNPKFWVDAMLLAEASLIPCGCSHHGRSTGSMCVARAPLWEGMSVRTAAVLLLRNHLWGQNPATWVWDHENRTWGSVTPWGHYTSLTAYPALLSQSTVLRGLMS